MNIQDNPYINLLELFSNKNKDISFILGDVVSVEPIRVKMNDLEIDKDDLLVNLDIKCELNNKVVLIFLDDIQQFILLCKVG